MTPIDIYVNSADINNAFTALTGFDMRGTHQWIGNYLIKNFIGNLYGFINDFKYYVIALVVIGGILSLAYSAFRFYRH